MTASVLHSVTITVLLTIATNAWAQQAAGGGSGDPNTGKPPMQAQELAQLVPKDSSKPRAVDISKANVHSPYRYDKAGVNCSLYPARCRGENY